MKKIVMLVLMLVGLLLPVGAFGYCGQGCEFRKLLMMTYTPPLAKPLPESEINKDNEAEGNKIDESNNTNIDEKIVSIEDAMNELGLDDDFSLRNYKAWTGHKKYCVEVKDNNPFNECIRWETDNELSYYGLIYKVEDKYNIKMDHDEIGRIIDLYLEIKDCRNKELNLNGLSDEDKIKMLAIVKFPRGDYYADRIYKMRSYFQSHTFYKCGG